MFADRLEQQLPINTVEVGLDVEIEYPVVAPAALSRCAHGIDRRFAGPVTVGVGMKHRLQDRFQVASSDFLGDSVGHSWNTQRPDATTIALRNIDPPHRRRKVTPRRQPVPEFVEVVLEISLKLRNRLPVYSSRSLIGLHTLEGLPDFPFGDLERLCLVHGLPFPVGQWPRLNNAAPSLQPHYRTFITTTGCSAPVLRIGTLALAVGAACSLSLHAVGVTERRFSRSIQKPGRASRRLHAGCRSGSLRASPELIPEEGSSPGSDIA